MSRTLLDVQHIQDICPRFRVLVIGRRNAGKTTILKKMSGSDGSDVEIRDVEGKKVDPSILQPTSTRGMSEIENEITFRSNPLFVFHDSRGIEAGADTDENSPLRPDYLWNFLEKRSKASKIRDQVHVVWFCIPMDKPRVPSEEFELLFFNGRLPVIAVFTKFESLIDEAYNNLPDDDTNEEDRESQAYQDAQSKFEKTALRAVQGTKNPPHQVVKVQQLNEPTGECTALTEKTNAALQNETLLNIFALAQQNSFEVGCQRVFRLMM
ncbi:hypothetical protein DFH08DRAFT_712480 [Mycena albidolilacea]|uniref:G domain-containing protein n=1 Tax=Mycena albidolilacea TaxID=1033008 RepID=A0AAD6ZGR6_9AGAR|nr:hypothetical protein DFH08DRAFT_712480 [Mycena albidolilacea]